MQIEDLKIRVNHHSSICIDEKIYIDPFNIKDKINNAEIVFITHSHWDHLDKDSILKVSNKNTVFVCTNDVKETLKSLNINENKMLIIKPNQKFQVSDVDCETFPAYNIFKDFHKKNNGWVGYKITLNGISYTICGDSDITDELRQLKTDVLFVPIGGTYTMDAKEAAELTNVIKPELVIPVHYGTIVGGIEPEKTFLENLNKNIICKFIIDKK